MELLECKHLCKKFDDKQILNDINITIPRGKIIGLLGKNGTGKSTLIKLINDLLTPTSGEVLINGKKPGIASKKVISYLPERSVRGRFFRTYGKNFKTKCVCLYFTGKKFICRRI